MVARGRFTAAYRRRGLLQGAVAVFERARAARKSCYRAAEGMYFPLGGIRVSFAFLSCRFGEGSRQRSAFRGEGLLQEVSAMRWI